MPEIHPNTRRAVSLLAQELDYQPNQLAKNLAKSRTRTIGVIVPNLGYYFFSAVLNSIEEAASQAGYSVLVCQSHESYEREKIHIETLLRSQVEGFIMSLSRDTDTDEHIVRLLRRQMPLVLFDRTADVLTASQVIVDNYEAAFQATQHLIENGCRRIAFLAGPPQLLLSNQRLAGYRAALARHSLPLDNGLIRHCDYTPGDALVQTASLMNLPQPPDGLITISDRIAHPAMHMLKQRGVGIPGELAVVSFNDEPVSAFLSPSLTSVSQPVQAMGAEAVRLLLAQIESGDELVPSERIVMNTKLIIRESSVRGSKAV